MNVRNKIEAYLSNNFKGTYRFNEPLFRHTTYHIGGPADYFVRPYDVNSLKEVLDFCRRNEINEYVLGNGSNILASDSGFRGIVIKLDYLNSIESKELYVKCGSGVKLSHLILYNENSGLAGLHSLSGIPGTVGGVLAMNAGTSYGEIGDYVQEVCVLDEFLNYRSIKKEEISFNYRSVPALDDKIILGCSFSLYNKDKIKLKECRLRKLEKRAEKQPLEYCSCGSVFKRPPVGYVGEMIEKVGLKGFRKGDAMISEKHAGFIVNLGHAKAEDIMYIIKKVQEVINRKYSVKLELEVKLLGFR